MQEIREFFEMVFTGFGLTDAVDILLVAFVVYKLMSFIFETRAEQIFKGILILVIVTFLSDLFNLHTLNWMCKGAVTLGAVAILIVFQPELRRALEIMGRGKIVKGRVTQTEKEEIKDVVHAISNAVRTFSREKTGALIVFERDTVLEDIAETGTILNAKITEQLLGNIFYEGSPLHDGAVIISDRSLYAAGCVLPLTKRQDLSKSLGTRHRAGIGITEISDALVIIVSEETGIISLAENGELERFLDAKTVEKRLLDFYINESQITGKLSSLFGSSGWFSRFRTKEDVNKKIYGAHVYGEAEYDEAEYDEEEVKEAEEINEALAEDLTESANAAEQERKEEEDG
ncbi:MAG: diadenylate cyclase CdaA [Firmicutes bacterium]|nr:diadenylate cyclase CdaA [Bacillota bacterium]